MYMCEYDNQSTNQSAKQTNKQTNKQTDQQISIIQQCIYTTLISPYHIFLSLTDTIRSLHTKW